MGGGRGASDNSSAPAHAQLHCWDGGTGLITKQHHAKAQATPASEHAVLNCTWLLFESSGSYLCSLPSVRELISDFTEKVGVRRGGEVEGLVPSDCRSSQLEAAAMLKSAAAVE